MGQLKFYLLIIVKEAVVSFLPTDNMELENKSSGWHLESGIILQQAIRLTCILFPIGYLYYPSSFLQLSFDFGE